MKGVVPYVNVTDPGDDIPIVSWLRLKSMLNNWGLIMLELLSYVHSESGIAKVAVCGTIPFSNFISIAMLVPTGVPTVESENGLNMFVVLSYNDDFSKYCHAGYA